jgi:hypothetical protein
MQHLVFIKLCIFRAWQWQRTWVLSCTWSALPSLRKVSRMFLTKRLERCSVRRRRKRPKEIAKYFNQTFHRDWQTDTCPSYMNNNHLTHDFSSNCTCYTERTQYVLKYIVIIIHLMCARLRSVTNLYLNHAFSPGLCSCFLTDFIMTWPSGSTAVMICRAIRQLV